MGVLLIGYGNAGRGDDGLGPAFAERISASRPEGCRIDIDYQLTVEHALPVADAATVVFVDAMIGGDAPFQFAPVAADGSADLASHSLSPQAVLALAEMLYGATPEAYVLGIAGISFGEIAEGLSETGCRNLDLAEAYFRHWLVAHGRGQRADQINNDYQATEKT